jgi:steroid 5-alpha reductase family enzyme
VEPIDFWLPIAVVFGGNTLAYVYCQLKTDNSYIDVFWGLTFITPIAALLIYFAAQGMTIYDRVILNTVLVTIWGVRLALHIGVRHTKEDFRYTDMRNRWMEGGLTAYYISAFVYVFMLQALFSLIVNSASLFTTIYTNTQGLIWSDYLGLAVWVFGFGFECIGD